VIRMEVKGLDELERQLMALGEKEEARRIIAAVPKEHPFELRYSHVDKVDWEACAQVLAPEEKNRLLRTGWG